MTVFLVGAGPGDPGLITVRGAELLARADHVVYDRLSASSLLELAPDGAELISVGKDPNGTSTPQVEINELLVALGRTGSTVVRLKGGDPYVFARGSEEVAALIDAGVAYEVVPGVTSALAAPSYAGVPVTERFTSTAVTIVTGHEDPTKSEDPIDLEAAARLGGTIVVLMGAKRWATIRNGLIGGGKPPDTPVAAIRWGTTDRQETVLSTLAELAPEHLKPPVTIVIGSVARADRASIQTPWFVPAGALDIQTRLATADPLRPLLGVTIAITRRSQDATRLEQGLSSLGARTLVVPAIVFGSSKDGPGSLESAVRSISSFAWVVVTSAHAARLLLGAISDLRRLGGVSIAAVGASTATTFSESRIGVDLVAGVASAEGLVSEFPSTPAGAESRRVLFVSSDQAADTVVDGLTALGWNVTRANAYSTGSRALDERERAALIDADVITIASPSAARSVAASVPELFAARDGVPVFVCSGETTARAVKGLLGDGSASDRVITAANPGVDGVAQAVVAWSASRPG